MKIQQKRELEKRDFFQQQRLRDKLKLRFAIEKFLSDDSFKSRFAMIPLNDANLESVARSIDSNELGKRYRSSHFANLLGILKAKKYEKRVIKLEEFIDDCFSNEAYNFKIDVQTERSMRNLFQKFIDFENLAVNRDQLNSYSD